MSEYKGDCSSLVLVTVCILLRVIQSLSLIAKPLINIVVFVSFKVYLVVLTFNITFCMGGSILSPSSEVLSKSTAIFQN